MRPARTKPGAGFTQSEQSPRRIVPTMGLHRTEGNGTMKDMTEAKVGRLARKALDMQREADHLCAEVEKVTGCEMYDGTTAGEIAQHFHGVSASLEMAMQEIAEYAEKRGYTIRW